MLTAPLPASIRAAAPVRITDRGAWVMLAETETCPSCGDQHALVFVWAGGPWVCWRCVEEG